MHGAASGAGTAWKRRWGHRRPRIGFIGLGIMGRPMARNLLRAGYSLTVYNRSRGPVDELAAEGAAPAGSPAELAAESDVIITIVTDSPDVEEVIAGERGVIHGARPGSAVIDMSTISPKVARELAARLAQKGVAMLDAPVSGGDKGAREGTLSIMVGGDREVFESCLPVLEAMGKTIVHVGENGMGQTVKLCNQIICSLNLLAVAEGLAFAAKAGADLEKVLQVVTRGAAGSWMLENLGPKMVAGDYAPGFMVKLQQKDLRLALEAAAEAGMPLPGTALVQQLFRHVEAKGFGSEGTQALVKALEALGDVRVAKRTGGQDLA
ncbi:MAG: 2-hydroxy-3-oxopropionate reductase [Firmicutes bacterium]|nr:2-hydroxy-3-oxopropionate reductase [Bacillota bacterium]MBO2521633.1 2-hydroxy-3-oxopropionate reductase [Bacillota bacterium]